MNFLHCFQSEWIKKRRTLSSWLVIIGAFFTPAIVLMVRLVRSRGLYAESISSNFWEKLWTSSWESMAIFLLPLGLILATSLITQVEFKNNTWKQLHTAPQTLTTIFLAKLAVIVVMILQCFILFNLGIYLSGVIPCLLTKGVPYPHEAVPYLFFPEGKRAIFRRLPANPCARISGEFTVQQFSCARRRRYRLLDFFSLPTQLEIWISVPVHVLRPSLFDEPR